MVVPRKKTAKKKTPARKKKSNGTKKAGTKRKITGIGTGVQKYWRFIRNNVKVKAAKKKLDAAEKVYTERKKVYDKAVEAAKEAYNRL